MARLHIYDPRERRLVGAADRLLGAAVAVARPFRRRVRPAAPRRILLLRLERIGDLLMAIPAIEDVRRLAPAAEIDLVVGSWNLAIARAIASVTRVETLDAEWLAREGGGLGLSSLVRATRDWRTRQYDLAINFEPDVRSNILLALSRARWIAGYRSGGGGPLLDQALEYDVTAHTTDNARRLVAHVLGTPAQGAGGGLRLSADAHRDAARLLGSAPAPLVGVHASGGRAVKQWPVERFGEVARRLADERGATIVLTGAPGDRPLVDAVTRQLPAARVIDAAGALDLASLGAVIASLDVFITGDTGPMHLAHAVGTPVVAVFGPSAPERYAPRGPLDRVVRIDLPCSPCNRIRLPPERCTGHTPDCLALIGVEEVLSAALSALDAARRERPRHARS